MSDQYTNPSGVPSYTSSSGVPPSAPTAPNGSGEYYNNTPGGQLAGSSFRRFPYQSMLPQITTTRRRKKFQGLFSRDIEYLLYALGDRPVSSDATVSCLDDILVEFLVDLCHEVMSYSKSQGRSRVKMNDLLFAFRDDPLKLARFEYINKQNMRIQKAKKLFEEKPGNFDEGSGLGGAGGIEDNSDDDEDDEDDAPKEESKKKKRKVTGNVMFKT